MTIYDQLRRDEGVRATMYRDELGNATVGVGHNLSSPLSARAIQVMLEDDVDAIDQELQAALLWAKSALDDARYGALLNLAFNMGVGGVHAGLLGFPRMLRAIQAQDWDAAARELLDSRYARQVGDRATRLAEQLRSGSWQ
jgi:lysozyme